MLLTVAPQDLRLVFDASGGGAKLNPIQLSALLQQLCKLAPAPGLLNAADRDSLTAFVDEVCACVDGKCDCV
jgi:hypothetical protein